MYREPDFAPGLRSGMRRAEPVVWLSAGALVAALLMLAGLFTLLATEGAAHFWPRPLVLLQSAERGPAPQLGIILDAERVPRWQLDPALSANGRERRARRLLLHRGGDEFFDSPLLWLLEEQVTALARPEKALVLERPGRGLLFGFLDSISSGSGPVSAATLPVKRQLQLLENGIGLAARADAGSAPDLRYRLRLANGQLVDLPLGELTRAHAPNVMSKGEQLRHFFGSLGRFLTDTPRRVNVQGGVFPAIVGTVSLVLIMSLIVSPLGVLAAVYLQEYAHRGVSTRLVRIAVNNLASVPSIVYGVFGLGFFVYSIGGSLDSLFFSDRLPAPTLGTPGLLWAALTMALLTLPVVIVATEEGLARVPRALREGSLALGATRAETLFRVVLPAASPALLTGLILAVARATGEVAPLLLVGVAKYAPGLPVSADFPYLHLDRQFMHLGFYIYDLGFQSPQLETVEGLVFATALLLVLIVVLLNLAAVMLRSRLRETFKTPDMF